MSAVRIVPVEPTEAMAETARATWLGRWNVERLYSVVLRDAIAAAPPAAENAELVERVALWMVRGLNLSETDRKLYRESARDLLAVIEGREP